MKGYIANTDYDWYRFLAAREDLEEVNFWQPGGGRGFRAIPAGAPVFFKLKRPHYVVAGFGIFARHARLPVWLAWECFGEANGTPDEAALRRQIERYRSQSQQAAPEPYEIGCLLVVEPVFFPQEQWIPQPSDWSRNIVQGAGYDLAGGEGRRIWEACQERAALSTVRLHEQSPRYGEPQLVRPRLGQGTFRIAVTEAYQRACAVTREHSLPVIEAAHIKPYGEGGPHDVANGIALRSDLHRLFDKGYLTVTSDHRLEVSRRLKDDYENGKTYYPMHGGELLLPSNPIERPSAEFLDWHHNEIYLG